MSSPTTHFRGKTVWITGASSGIGREVARSFASHGARLILSARRENLLRDLSDELSKTGTEVAVHPLDLSDAESLPERAATAEAYFGGIDVFFSNAGISTRGLVENTQLAVIERVMQVNFTGAVALTIHVLPKMLERGGGHIVAVSSVMGKFATPLRAGYCASKHAVHGFFESLASEVYGRNVAVTIIVPGWVRTGISESALEGDGSLHGTTDPGQANAQRPEVYADSILQAVAAGKPEHYVALDLKIRAALFLDRFFPGVLRTALRKAKVT